MLWLSRILSAALMQISEHVVESTLVSTARTLLTRSPLFAASAKARVPSFAHADVACGDLLLYVSDGSLLARLIAWRTHGRFVHCAIAISSTECVESLTSGIARDAISGGYVLVKTSALLNPAERQAARDWLLAQVGRRYGVVDVLDFVVSLLTPNGPFLFSPTSFDCSDLAVRFLDRAGVALDASLRESPALVSPNDLARAFAVA